MQKTELRGHGTDWSGEVTSTVCVFLETEHCVLFLSQKEMVGDDGFSVGREDGVRFFDTDVDVV